MKRKKAGTHFVVCINNKNAEDLELRKAYRVIPDKNAEKEDFIRVIDESGEDYLYPASYFIPLHLEKTEEKALLKAS